MAGTPHSSRTYARITARLLESVSTSSAAGREALAGELLKRIADGIIAACRPKVTGDSLAERLAQALVALADEGLEYESNATEGSFVLSRLDCRWSRVAGECGGALQQETRIVSALLAAEVQPIHESNTPGASKLLVRAMRD